MFLQDKLQLTYAFLHSYNTRPCSTDRLPALTAFVCRLQQSNNSSQLPITLTLSLTTQTLANFNLSYSPKTNLDCCTTNKMTSWLRSSAQVLSGNVTVALKVTFYTGFIGLLSIYSHEEYYILIVYE